MEILLKWVAPGIALFSVFAGGVLAYARLNRIDKAVHLPDGKWRFAPAEDVCGKLDKMDKKIDAIQKQQTNDMREIATFMGKVEEAIKNGK